LDEHLNATVALSFYNLCVIRGLSSVQLAGRARLADGGRHGGAHGQAAHSNGLRFGGMAGSKTSDGTGKGEAKSGSANNEFHS